MSIAHKRLRALEKQFGASAELDDALAALHAATPELFGRFIGAAMNQASDRQLIAVSVNPAIVQKFFAAQFRAILDEWIEEADAAATTRGAA